MSDFQEQGTETRHTRGQGGCIKRKACKGAGPLKALPLCFTRDERCPAADYLNDRLVWRIRSFWMLMCPRKFVFGTVTV